MKVPDKWDTIDNDKGRAMSGVQKIIDDIRWIKQMQNDFINCVEELDGRTITLLNQQETDEWRVVGPGKIEDRLNALEQWRTCMTHKMSCEIHSGGKCDCGGYAPNGQGIPGKTCGECEKYQKECTQVRAFWDACVDGFVPKKPTCGNCAKWEDCISDWRNDPCDYTCYEPKGSGESSANPLEEEQ